MVKYVWGVEFIEVILLVVPQPSGNYMRLDIRERALVHGGYFPQTDLTLETFSPKINIISCCPWKHSLGNAGLGEGHIEGLA